MSLATLFFFLGFGTLMSSEAFADELYDVPIRLTVDGDGPFPVAAYDASYENNTYLSLRSLAAAMANSQKPFRVSYTYDTVNGHTENECIHITTGEADPESHADPNRWAEDYAVLQANALELDGEPRRYWTYASSDGDDLYMSITDLAMALDLDIRCTGENELSIDTAKGFSLTLPQLDRQEYFDTLSGVICGDLTTGEILYSRHADRPSAIASTSKLMTALIALDEVADGSIALDDTVTVSAKAARISRSYDGMIELEEGQLVTVRDLLYGMLLPSSNESAITLAEYISGSEDAFAEEMNRRAAKLGLKTARFVNASGLPCYRENAALTKLHNSMSAEELYTLAAYLVKTHPEVLEYSSAKYAWLDSMQYDAFNTNPLLLNLPGVRGLKTGTTNRAGCCIVVLMEQPVGDETHRLLCVLLDAETSAERCTKAEVLLRCVRKMMRN